MFEKIVCVTRKTRLEELIHQYGSERQARFHIEHGGGEFNSYLREHQRYLKSLDSIKPVISSFENTRFQFIDREIVKSFMFSEKDLIVTLGQDGLVANTAKYVGPQPIIAINPDPERFDGILLPFQTEQCFTAIRSVLNNDYVAQKITLGEAKTSDGQTLLAFNDFFIGTKSHTSARYLLNYQKTEESQSSSGIIVSTGAGSTGWMSSIMNMVTSIHRSVDKNSPEINRKIKWDDQRLIFAVREPFISKSSSAKNVFGFIEDQEELVIESQMPNDGVIFSDGMEKDFIKFNSGLKVSIKSAKQNAHLVQEMK